MTPDALRARGLDPDDIAFAGVLGQRALLQAGTLTAAELLEVHLERIDRLDGRLRAFRTLFREQARATAAALSPDDPRPLAGIPVAVKDDSAVAGHRPSYGTGSYEPAAERDDAVVGRLRAAGAVVVGVTTLPELALWPFTESAMWGSTRNPWDLATTPGGSSGGSAAAVAAGLVPVATAGDGGGSIRIPAACCGLVGLKSQRGVVPVGGEDEPAALHWHGLSVKGCLTRSVADQAHVLAVLSGGAIGAEPVVPGPLRVAWSTATALPAGTHPTVVRALHVAVDALRALGHQVGPADPDLRGVRTSFVLRYLLGAAQDHARLAQPHATEPRTRVVAAVGRRLPRRALDHALRTGEDAARRLATLPGGADVLLLPVLPGPPQPVGALRGLRALAAAPRVAGRTAPANVTGQPAVAVPVHVDGRAVGVQLVGRPGADDQLLGLAAALEAALGWTALRPPLT